MTEKHELQSLPEFFIKGLIVTAAAFLMVFGLNAAMQGFLDAELAVVEEAAARAAAAEAALAGAKTEAEAARLAAEAAVRKAEQYEQFYQKYKTRHCYHYYGQFYEMFENLYNADTIIIGTSHAAHGINPKYLEEAVPRRSWFNFALNGSNPKYYLDWWKVFLESGYPIPETIVFSVDWFMCDDGWLWRRIDFDTNPDCPAAIMRKIRKTRLMQAEDAERAAEIEEKLAAQEAAEAEKEATRADKINWLDPDEVLTWAFNRIPVIYSRDRIPEMLGWYIGGRDADALPAAEGQEETADDIDSDAPLPEVPVYVHERQVDKDNNITSEYYKGYVPWEADYNGRAKDQPCDLKEDQWAALDRLLDVFEDYGIHVVFVECPEYIEGRRARGMDDTGNRRLEEIAEARGITFFNYNIELAGEINADHTNFSDWGHMNTKGSTAFSKLLAARLAEYFETRE